VDITSDEHHQPQILLSACVTAANADTTSLSPISHTIIWMCDAEGMTLSKSATMSNVSTATAYRRLQQAHDEFRATWDA
jgi:DNA-directed RNA polymerase specialized sigma24 family protein